MKKILIITTALVLALTTCAFAGPAKKYYSPEYSGTGGSGYFSIANVFDKIDDKSFIPMVPAEKCAAPVTVTSETELNGFGVSTLIDVGAAFIEGAYLSPDGYDAPFENGQKIKKGKTFTINDIGVYYIWATKAGFDVPAEATIVVDSVKADYTKSKVYVNGVETQFEAYNINNNNYFKLRDIAKALSGTEKQFEVKWNQSNNSIDLISGSPYTSVGGELVAGNGKQKDAFAGTGDISKDGMYASAKSYLINNNNYFKLRDLGMMFDFDVSWDGAKNRVVIDTSKSYTED